MIRSAVTISLVDEAASGPFVFRGNLAGACKQAQMLGFDGVELFLPDSTAVDLARLRILLNDHGLALAAVGTGAGWLRHGLHLAMPEADQRVRAREYIRSLIRLGGALHAPAIIGSMQGRASTTTPHATALGYLADALDDLSETAREFGVPLLFEPLNRYETDLVNTLDGGLRLLHSVASPNVALVADLFHMNIEESHSADAIRAAGERIGHVHFVDSNRRAAGLGQLDLDAIAEALHEIGFAGFASAEALPYPEPLTAAQQTIQTFGRLFRVGPGRSA